MWLSFIYFCLLQNKFVLKLAHNSDRIALPAFHIWKQHQHVHQNHSVLLRKSFSLNGDSTLKIRKVLGQGQGNIEKRKYIILFFFVKKSQENKLKFYPFSVMSKTINYWVKCMISLTMFQEHKLFKLYITLIMA